MKLPRFTRQTVFLMVSGLAGLLLAGVLLHLRADILERSQNIISLKEKARSRLSAFDSLSLVRQEYASVKPYLPQVDELLPSEDDLLNFPREVAAIAHARGVDATVSFRGGNGSSAGNAPSLRSTDFTFTAQGPANGIFATLAALDQSRYIVKFTSMDFTNQSGVFRVTMDGQVFSR